MIESGLQTECLAYAEKWGFLAVKLTAPGRKGWPDIEIICPPRGKTIRIELKHPGKTGRVRPHQLRWKERLEKVGAEVHIIDSLDEFKTLIHKEIVNGRKSERI